ncbi:uncharacterized protein LOC108097629 [Drosophila ficusphila]|uniref:uncharacterized protein LOC108097629 n=1 Tax=Drosophila ficusphila TaxID=30025 RepID=UPI0007E5DADD|nr:uncharacterized protein LOC108097629 [Drosophila ficusphila]
MDLKKLKNIENSVRIGGKGSVRRKFKYIQKSAAAVEKRLAAAIGNLSLYQYPGIHEISFQMSDSSEINVIGPKAEGSVASNVFLFTSQMFPSPPQIAKKPPKHKPLTKRNNPKSAPTKKCKKPRRGDFEVQMRRYSNGSSNSSSSDETPYRQGVTKSGSDKPISDSDVSDMEMNLGPLTEAEIAKLKNSLTPEDSPDDEEVSEAGATAAVDSEFYLSSSSSDVEIVNQEIETIAISSDDEEAKRSDVLDELESDSEFRNNLVKTDSEDTSDYPDSGDERLMCYFAASSLVEVEVEAFLEDADEATNYQDGGDPEESSNSEDMTAEAELNAILDGIESDNELFDPRERTYTDDGHDESGEHSNAEDN